MVWVPVEVSDGVMSAKVQEFMGEDHYEPSRQLIQRSPRLDRRALTGSLEVLFREDCMLDATKRPNKSIDRVLGTGSYRPQEWRGPVLVMRKNGFDLAPKVYEDIMLADYRHLVDYFEIHGYASQYAKAEKPKRDRVRGVKINCVGEQVRSKVEVFAPVEVPSQSYERYGYTVGHIIPISKVINFPLRAWKCPLKERPVDPNTYNTENVTATIINISSDPKSNDYGWSPHHWQSDVGNVLLLRDDGEDLDLALAETFCRWIEWNLWPRFEDALGLFSQAPPQVRVQKQQSLQESMTRKAMDAYGVQLREKGDQNQNVIPALLENEEEPEETRESKNIKIIAKSLREANKADRDYGRNIVDLVGNEEEPEIDITYLQTQVR